jgi:hypothetical protein
VPGEGKIAPTATTCNDFRLGTAGDLTTIFYGVKNGKIGNVSPGVLFYYSHATATGSSFTIDIVQTNNNAAFNLFGVHKGQVNLYNAADCSAASVRTTITASGTVHIVVSGATFGQTFIVGVKYDPGSVVGTTVGTSRPTVHYDFSTKVDNVLVEVDPDGLDLKPKSP